jgi:hypothetical protein
VIFDVNHLTGEPISPAQTKKINFFLFAPARCLAPPRLSADLRVSASERERTHKLQTRKSAPNRAGASHRAGAAVPPAWGTRIMINLGPVWFLGIFPRLSCMVKPEPVRCFPCLSSPSSLLLIQDLICLTGNILVSSAPFAHLPAE